mmetsp:Transcript_34510/g.95417  ORF Transcript_34510/g.95417 Transcript_34510/m.95417 type:complete len:369 (-) Transcript_34510:168-1274(-)
MNAATCAALLALLRCPAATHGLEGDASCPTGTGSKGMCTSGQLLLQTRQAHRRATVLETEEEEEEEEAGGSPGPMTTWSESAASRSMAAPAAAIGAASPLPVNASGLALVESGEWITGTWITGYWDCCKPSCSWPGKGRVDVPVAACSASTGQRLEDPGADSVCQGGPAASCTDNRPFVVSPSLSMGFAAAAVGGVSGLSGDDNCGQCFELLFTDRQHLDKNTGSLWGGSSPSLTGRRMILQVTNIGYDVKGNHSFDIQIPGAGQGIFAKGCATQYPDQTVDDFDCGKRHGGCSDKGGCARLPAELQKGCEWHFEWFEWLKSGGRSNNPFVKFRRVQCPMKLVAISGATPTDDTDFPIASESPDFYYI